MTNNEINMAVLEGTEQMYDMKNIVDTIESAREVLASVLTREIDYKKVLVHYEDLGCLARHLEFLV